MQFIQRRLFVAGSSAARDLVPSLWACASLLHPAEATSGQQAALMV